MSQNWKDIVNTVLDFRHGEVAPNLTHDSRISDKADCCGTAFADHISWLGHWLPCSPTRKAAWTRKKNREANLRKRHERIADAVLEVKCHRCGDINPRMNTGCHTCGETLRTKGGTT